MSTKQVKVRLALACLDEMRAWCAEHGQSLATAIEVAWIRSRSPGTTPGPLSRQERRKRKRTREAPRPRPQTAGGTP